ncbi:hypothetical protein UlMin_006590 [Ulmus minor]
MKKQDSLPSSSSHRENVTAEKIHAKAIGCMSGLFHFLSRYQNRRKSLTSGKEKEKNEVVAEKKTIIEGQIAVERNKCEVPRSPTLPAEIRLSNSVNSPENFRAPPALVARLMGLEEAPAIVSRKIISQPPEYCSAVAKRRQLIGALEKCDQDLKALKKIIDAVRSAERLRSPAAIFRSSEVDQSPAGKRLSSVKILEINNSEQPSPVSVLDEFTRSPLSSYQYSKRQSYNHGLGRMQHVQRQQKKKPGEEDFISPNIFDRIVANEISSSLQKKAASAAAAAAVAIAEGHYYGVVETEEASAAALIWGNKSMKESVEEVCGDIAWGESREIGRIGLALQEHICRDLIEDFVSDMMASFLFKFSFNRRNRVCSSLPFEACKRRLCF